jgi:type VI secretion system secreted protein Hcp
MKKLLFVLLLLVGSAVQLSAAIYMKFPGINGDVQTETHINEIELNSLIFGLSRAVTGSGATREVAVPAFSEISLTKGMDTASTRLMIAAAAGKSVDNVIIAFITTGQDKLFTFCKITLSGVLVTGYSASSGGDRPSESLSLNFTKIQVEYFNTDPILPQPPSFGYDLAILKTF